MMWLELQWQYCYAILFKINEGQNYYKISLCYQLLSPKIENQDNPVLERVRDN